MPSSCDSEELLLPSTDDEETLSQCGEAQVSVAVDDRNEIPNVDAAMLLTQCSDPGEAVLVAQCSEGHVAQTTGGVPGDGSGRIHDLAGHRWRGAQRHGRSGIVRAFGRESEPKRRWLESR